MLQEIAEKLARSLWLNCPARDNVLGHDINPEKKVNELYVFKDLKHVLLELVGHPGMRLAAGKQKSLQQKRNCELEIERLKGQNSKCDAKLSGLENRSGASSA